MYFKQKKKYQIQAHNTWAKSECLQVLEQEVSITEKEAIVETKYLQVLSTWHTTSMYAKCLNQGRVIQAHVPRKEYISLGY